MRPENATALAEWAVTCDALARGEQVLLLRPDDLASGEADAAGPLRHAEFWLRPTWGDQRIADVTDPYRDRLRRLLELRRDDGRLRVRHYATVEYRERIADLDRLLALDVEHTLNSRAVEQRWAAAGGPGPWLLLLRIYERPVTVVLREETGRRETGPWVRLERPIATAGARPVLGDDRFLREKARLLQLAGSIEAV